MIFLHAITRITRNKDDLEVQVRLQEYQPSWFWNSCIIRVLRTCQDFLACLFKSFFGCRRCASPPWRTCREWHRPTCRCVYEERPRAMEVLSQSLTILTCPFNRGPCKYDHEKNDKIMPANTKHIRTCTLLNTI